MLDVVIPSNFLRISEASKRLAQGMWGGLERPTAVQKIKRQEPKLRVAWGPWRESAGHRLRITVINGELPVYIVPLGRPRLGRQQLLFEKIEMVPPAVLKRLIPTPRGRRRILTDRPYRPTLKTTERDARLLSLLEAGILMVRTDEFSTWYQAERAKGRWPSQKDRISEPSAVRTRGRPTKQTEELRNAILGLGRQAEWSARDGLNELRRRLIASGRSKIPNPATLGRLVDAIHDETGDAEFQRKKRLRNK
jgi:hypothetical protein